MAKIPKEWGLYRPKQKLAVRAELAALTGAGRPVRSTANGQNCDRWAPAVDRSGRPKQPESRALIPGRPARSTDPTREQSCSLSVDLSGRPTRLAADVHRSVHVGRPNRSTGLWCGRPTRSTDQACQPKSGPEKHVKIFLKNQRNWNLGFLYWLSLFIFYKKFPKCFL